MPLTNEQRENIKTAIAERTPIDVGGQPVDLEFVDSAETLVGPKQFTLRFRGTTPDGQVHHVDLHINEFNINDGEYIADNAESGVRDIISGLMPPGTRALL